MNKILVALQGKTLILHYQVNPGVAHNGGERAAYIAVQPSAELARFDLKGLTPEMFCVNIADMVNLRGLFTGMVENDQQVGVARWEINEEAYRLAVSSAALKLTHRQIVACLEKLPGYLQELDDQFIDFEECVVPHDTFSSGYRLTVVTEDMGKRLAPYAFYSLDTHAGSGWRGIPPPLSDQPATRAAITAKLQALAAAGVQLSQTDDETDYALGE